MIACQGITNSHKYFLLLHTDYSITSTSDRPFLSWQTWDLTKIMYYGFTGFCKDFLAENPTYRVYPMRLNGSAIETVFSQLKYIASGHLSSVNYASARASLLTRGTVSGRKKKVDYRDVHLYIRQHSLKRKHYKK